jgi:hypothetical protein
MVYANAVLTATGVDITGNQASIQDWSKASVFCTGVTIQSPCDTANQSTGPLPVGYASTGSNEFYGDQTINGMVSITGGVLMNPQIFVGNITIPDGYNAALIGPITITGSIGLTGSSVLAIL